MLTMKINGNATACNLKDILEIMKDAMEQRSTGYAYDIGSVFESVRISIKDISVNALEIIILKQFVSSITFKEPFIDKMQISQNKTLQKYPDIRDDFEDMISNVLIDEKEDMYSKAFHMPLLAINFITDIEFTGQKILNLFGYRTDLIIKKYFEEKIYESEKKTSDFLKKIFEDSFIKVLSDYFNYTDRITPVIMNNLYYKYMTPLSEFNKIAPRFRLSAVLTDTNFGINFNTFTPEQLSENIRNIKLAVSPTYKGTLTFMFSMRTTFKEFMGFFLNTDYVVHFISFNEIEESAEELNKTLEKDSAVLINRNYNMTFNRNAMYIKKNEPDESKDIRLSKYLLSGDTYLKYVLKIPVNVNFDMEDKEYVNPLSSILSTNNELCNYVDAPLLSSLEILIDNIINTL